MRTKTPLAAIGQGRAAGLLGNAIFTGYQAAKSKLTGPDGEPERTDDGSPQDWSDAAAPAQSATASSKASSSGTCRSSTPRR